MPLVDHTQRQVTLSIILDGAPFSGRTQNLTALSRSLPASTWQLVSTPSPGWRVTTLQWSNPPLKLPFKGYRCAAHLALVANASPKFDDGRLALFNTCDGVLRVVDSSPAASQQNQGASAWFEGWRQRRSTPVPVVVQFNKRDLADALPVETLQAQHNTRGDPHTLASALTGDGVRATMDLLLNAVLRGM